MLEDLFNWFVGKGSQLVGEDGSKKCHDD